MQPSAISRVSCLSLASKTALRGPVAIVALAVLAVGCQSTPHSTPVAPAAGFVARLGADRDHAAQLA